MTLAEQLQRWIAPLKNKINSMILKAVLESVDDADGMQFVKVKVNGDEAQDKLARVQNYGMTSHPKKDAEALSVFLRGDRGDGIIIAVDDTRYRLKGLAEGEVALYTDEGDTIELKRNGVIIINAANTIKLGASATEAVLKGDTFQNRYYNAHIHTGGFVSPTSIPVEQADALSTKVKTE
jgi:phage baseplate assembly protein V